MQKKQQMLVVAAAMSLALSGCSSGTAANNGEGASSTVEPVQQEEIQSEWWPDDSLAAKVPTPRSSSGEIDNNNETILQAWVFDSDEAAFNDYVKRCEAAGFTVDEEKIGVNYEAFNEEGYKVSVYFWKDDQKFALNLEPPIQLSEIVWPTTGPAAGVPAPSSTMGKTDVNTSTRYCVLIGKTPLKDYSAYVDSLISAGFDVDYSRQDKWFRATNADGYKVIAEYQGFDTMYVWIDSPDA